VNLYLFYRQGMMMMMSLMKPVQTLFMEFKQTDLRTFKFL